MEGQVTKISTSLRLHQAPLADPGSMSADTKAHFVQYEQGRILDPVFRDYYSLSGDDWDAMGRPKVITITIEPGGLLIDE